MADQERNLIFNLRNAFVQTLQAKAVPRAGQQNLTYYDHELSISRNRFKAGDIAQVDQDRLELQRVQYESDLQTAEVNLRTAKIQLLQLLNGRTPIEQFDVTGPFDFNEQILALDELRRDALEERPDLKAAVESVDKAKTDYKLAVANGSTDPTFGVDFARNPPIPVYIGFNVTIPLRIFDRNQGEKARTRLDITRNEKLRDAAQAQVFSDVDSAYATLNSTVTLLRPYKAKYLAASRASARYDRILLSARAGRFVGLPGRPERLSGRASDLSESGGLLSERRESVESRGGTRGDPMKHFFLIGGSSCAAGAWLLSWQAAMHKERAIRRPKRRRRPRSSTCRTPVCSKWTTPVSSRWRRRASTTRPPN